MTSFNKSTESYFSVPRALNQIEQKYRVEIAKPLLRAMELTGIPDAEIARVKVSRDVDKRPKAELQFEDERLNTRSTVEVTKTAEGTQIALSRVSLGEPNREYPTDVYGLIDVAPDGSIIRMVTTTHHYNFVHQEVTETRYVSTFGTATLKLSSVNGDERFDRNIPQEILENPLYGQDSIPQWGYIKRMVSEHDYTLLSSAINSVKETQHKAILVQMVKEIKREIDLEIDTVLGFLNENLANVSSSTKY